MRPDKGNIPPDLVRRLETLERQALAWRRAGLVALVLIVSALLLVTASLGEDAGTTVEAREFLLKENRKLTGSEGYATLTEKFPGEKINKNSFGVAFYSARKKLGIKSGRRRKSGAKQTVIKKRPASVKIENLKAAANFLGEFGNADDAIAAIKQLSSLQIK